MRLTDNFDYLQRVGFEPATLTANLPKISAPSDKLRRLVRINSVGRLEKAAPSIAKLGNDQLARLPSEDALTGLYGAKIALAFLVSSDSRGVAIHLGIWSPVEENATQGQLDEQKAVLESVLHGIFPAVELKERASTEIQLPKSPLSGIALGIPSVKPPDPLDNSLQLDRLVRALFGAQWAFLVLAKPVDESRTTAVRNSVVNEMRVVESAVKAQTVPGPLAEAYAEMLKIALKSLTHAEAVGAWRTAVYLLGDTASYYRLSSAWRGIFSGDQSLPEPVRVWESGVAGDLALKWAMPNTEGAPSPGLYTHPFQYQTLLSSTQLAAYVHLPQLETSGFKVSIVPNFDAVPPEVKKDDVPLRLGKVLQPENLREKDYEKLPETFYAIGLKDLTRHAFVAGVTGAGKTNTIFYLLKGAAQSGVPFLVIEPAKKEYRALLDDPSLRGDLQVFTLGDELTSPFRLNPFEVVSWRKIPVGVHLALLRSVFSASFGMFTPLPQILEKCLHTVYKDRGWDIAANDNHRLDNKSDVANTFPTLSDLAGKADEVIQKLGYDDEITADMRGALLTRINGLRAGGKGRMLDVQRSLPMDALLKHPTVLELEGMGDDDDKAFVMGLLLIRLYEHRRAGGEVAGLQHLLVIEEAHRLLTNVGPRSSQEEADPRGKAVETFANLLSEIRAYGQGVIVADQIPVKLASDIIKNTNLKIAHRVVAADDRMALAGAMAMDERQSRALATLTVGEAALFSEGDDAPILVQVPPAKDFGGQSPPDDERVRDYMSSSKTLESYGRVFQPLLPDVDMSLPAAYLARDAARTLSDDSSFRRDFVRLVVSITEDDEALDRLWNDVLVRAQTYRQRGMEEKVMLRCLLIYASEWFAHRRGSQASWSYADTAELEDKLRAVLLAKLEGGNSIQALESFRDLMKYRLHARPFEPFPGCAEICKQEQDRPMCLYRHAVADVIANAKEDLPGEWNAAYGKDKAAGQGLPDTWAQTQRASAELVESDSAQQEAGKRIRLCYAQHMLATQFAEEHDKILTELLTEASNSENGGGRDASEEERAI